MEQATPDPVTDDDLDGEDVRVTADGVQDTAQEVRPPALAASPPDRVENADS
ncbi:MAG: hypothetical protein M3Z04_23060 [Chloroflexota bacterium]|nr:hypothetical protein [Chloroflexota bacterium]